MSISAIVNECCIGLELDSVWDVVLDAEGGAADLVLGDDVTVASEITDDDVTVTSDGETVDDDDVTITSDCETVDDDVTLDGDDEDDVADGITLGTTDTTVASRKRKFDEDETVVSLFAPSTASDAESSDDSSNDPTSEEDSEDSEEEPEDTTADPVMVWTGPVAGFQAAAVVGLGTAAHPVVLDDEVAPPPKRVRTGAPIEVIDLTLDE